MRIKLFYKFFGIILFSIVISHMALAAVLYYLGNQNFSKFLDNRKHKEFSDMAERLGYFHEANGGFGRLASGEIPLHIAVVLSDMKVGEISELAREPIFKGKNNKPEYRVFTVFDKDMRYLAGGLNDPDDMRIFPVISGGETVGYFGALKRENMPDPFADSFLERQSRMFLITSLLAILLASVTAMWLSRSVLSPIRKLNTATSKISGRNFDVEIDVNTKDELEELAENFNKMVATLKEYELKQSRWISDISHELRTPLSVILGSMEAIQDGVRKPDEETIYSIYKNAVRMKRMVNELHDITLAESGGLVMNMVQTDILQELRGMLDFYQVRLSEFNMRLNIECDIPAVMIQADVVRINQVFINILENAIKYASKPGVLFVECSADGGVLEIIFEDTGPGVADEHLPYLFDRLYRVDKSRNTAAGGSGLGLSICRYIIEHHKGTITADKGRRGGLKITIRLPQETA